MSERTASFKVTLVSKGQKREVRRFMILTRDLSNYSILRDKLKFVFQSIERVPFKITWEDDESDQVLISSDEELRIAVTEMQGDVYRLTVETLEKQTPDVGNGGSIHAKIICDGCNGEVRGFRYTCVQCPNYDLCAKCEMSEQHPEHFMVRIPHPVQWRPEFGRRLAHQMAKSAYKHRGQGSCGEERSRASGHHHHSYHGCPAGQRYQMPQFFQQLFRNMWDQYIPQPGEPEGEAAAAAASNTESNNGEEEGHVAYLRTIGETVASLLDPLGIDVNIEVETKKKENSETGGVSEQEVKKEMESSAEKDDEKKRGSDEGNKLSKEERPAEAHGTPAVDEPKRPSVRFALEAKSNKKGTSDSPDADDWTVINEEETPQAAGVVQEHDGPSLSKRSSQGEENSKVVYPKLILLDDDMSRVPEPITPKPLQFLGTPNQVPAPADPNQNLEEHPAVSRIYPRQPPFHPPMRPHISQALDAMTSMGFRNEHGWLTSLLESVNGDIHKALDILQPVRR